MFVICDILPLFKPENLNLICNHYWLWACRRLFSAGGLLLATRCPIVKVDHGLWWLHIRRDITVIKLQRSALAKWWTMRSHDRMILVSNNESTLVNKACTGVHDSNSVAFALSTRVSPDNPRVLFFSVAFSNFYTWEGKLRFSTNISLYIESDTRYERIFYGTLIRSFFIYLNISDKGHAPLTCR